MSVLPFLHFFSFLAYCYLGIYIWIKNPKALVNRICAGFSFCFAVWSYAFIFLHGPGTGIEEARLHAHISSFGWIGFSSFFLWFILVFTGNTRITKKKWFYPVLFGIPAVLIYQQWGGFIINDFAREWYGLRSLYQASIWPYIFFVYYLSFMGIGFYLTFRFMRRTSNRVLKKQAKIILVTMVTSVVLGSFTDVIFTLANTLVIPNIADVTTLIWAFGAAYAIARYDFLTITPATAAENIISTMFDCLILLDPSGKISRVNQATLNVLGYTEAELKDKPVSTLLAPGEDGAVPGVEDAVKEIVGRRAVKNKEFRFRTKDGQTLPVLISSSVLEDVSGTAAGIVCVAKEFSEHKMLEEETLKSEKLEAIGMLAGGIAHDFNNVLSIILGNLQLAKEELESRVLTVKWLEGAEKAASQSVDLARKFITFAEGEWLDKRAVNLPHLIETMKAAGLPRNSPDSGTSMPVSYDLNLPLHLPPVQGDEGQLIQVFRNLFLNAVEALQPQQDQQEQPAQQDTEPVIWVQAENETIDADIREKGKFLLEKGKYVKLLIRDRGTGIVPEHIEKVFDPYFTTKSAPGRHGLGLTVCYSIIKKHGGHIALESAPQWGTTVTVYLPVFNGDNSRGSESK